MMVQATKKKLPSENQPSNPGLSSPTICLGAVEGPTWPGWCWMERTVGVLQRVGIGGWVCQKHIPYIYIPYHWLNWRWIGWIGWLKWIGIKIGILFAHLNMCVLFFSECLWSHDCRSIYGTYISINIYIYTYSRLSSGAPIKNILDKKKCQSDNRTSTPWCTKSYEPCKYPSIDSRYIALLVDILRFMLFRMQKFTTGDVSNHLFT